MYSAGVVPGCAQMFFSRRTFTKLRDNANRNTMNVAAVKRPVILVNTSCGMYKNGAGKIYAPGIFPLYCMFNNILCKLANKLYAVGFLLLNRQQGYNINVKHMAVLHKCSCPALIFKCYYGLNDGWQQFFSNSVLLPRLYYYIR